MPAQPSPVSPIHARAYDLAIGQVAEWQAWTRLVATSLGDLHVFLPLKDQGIDGIIHRISTDEYARVQVKGRRHYRNGIRFLVPLAELADDRAMILAVELIEGGRAIGDTALLVDVPTFLSLAWREESLREGVLYYGTVAFPPRPTNRWAPWCVPADQLAERLLPPAAVPAARRPVPPGRGDWERAGHLGFRAEMELLYRASSEARLNVFKAFPDLEPNEYVMYDLVSRGLVGIQVKAVSLSTGDEATLNVYRPALRPSAKTWFVIFVAEGSEPPLLDHCAVVPSGFVAEHLHGRGKYGVMPVQRHVTGELAPWRVPLNKLGVRLAEVAASLA